MKNNYVFKLITSITLTSLMLIGGIYTYTANKSQEDTSNNIVESKINNDLKYDVYLRALDSGFTGNYQDWLDSIKGSNGNAIELRVDDKSGFLQWKYVTESANNWRNLIAMADLIGADGIRGDKGPSGFDGLVPFVGDNGNWWIGLEDTGIRAMGIEGTSGANGANGQDGLTPYIGQNGNWWIGLEDTGIIYQGATGITGNQGADGQDGLVPFIGANGNWWIGLIDTGVRAEGLIGNTGSNGQNGFDGLIPYVGYNGNWWVGPKDTDIKATGFNGQNGLNGQSAYEMYIQTHFDYLGSEQQWLNDLINGELTPKEYFTVTFDSNFGSHVESQIIEKGRRARMPEEPVLADYVFDGWYINGDEKWVFGGYNVTEDITLTAKWLASSLTAEDKKAVLLDVANSFQLVRENDTGTVLYRDEVSDLVDGRDLTLRTKANRNGNLVTIEWSYKEGVDGAGRPLGGFEFKDIDGETSSARPGYPEYELEIDSGGNDISVIPVAAVARLYANLSLDGETLRVYFDMYLQPQMKIDWKPLDTIRDSEMNSIVGARGYITSIYADNNSATIQDGRYAITLFKVQPFATLGLKIGDYVETVGSFGGYNGVSQLTWIRRLNKAAPAEHDAQLPVVHNITPADFKEFFDATTPTEQFLTSLYELDSARVKVDAPLTILRAVDANGAEIALNALPTIGRHADIILGAKVGTVDIEIKLSINYHVGSVVQQAIKDKLIAAGIGGHITYDGILNWYNEPILNPMTANDIIVVY